MKFLLYRVCIAVNNMNMNTQIHVLVISAKENKRAEKRGVKYWGVGEVWSYMEVSREGHTEKSTSQWWPEKANSWPAMPISMGGATKAEGTVITKVLRKNVSGGFKE